MGFSSCARGVDGAAAYNIRCYKVWVRVYLMHVYGCFAMSRETGAAFACQGSMDPIDRYIDRLHGLGSALGLPASRLTFNIYVLGPSRSARCLSFFHSFRRNNLGRFVTTFGTSSKMFQLSYASIFRRFWVPFEEAATVMFFLPAITSILLGSSSLKTEQISMNMLTKLLRYNKRCSPT